MQEMWVRYLGQEDALEKEMATHSRILAWEIPWTEDPGGLQSMRLQKSQTQILYQLSHQGSPRVLEWVAHPFSRGSSQPWNWTGVSCIANEFFTNWAIREARYANILFVKNSFWALIEQRSWWGFKQKLTPEMCWISRISQTHGMSNAGRE